MLPGFRFLFAAIALSVSILIFGLGAAALLRAAHEEFASNPSWRTAPEPPMLAQQAPDANKPTLAMLQIEPQPPVRKAEPAQVTDATSDISPALAAPAEPESVVVTPPQTEKVAALDLQEMSTPADAAKVEAKTEAKVEPEPDVKTEIKTEAPPARSAAMRDAAPAPAEETKVAAVDDAKPEPSDASAAATEPAKPETASTEVVISEAVTSEPAQSEPAKPEPTVAPASVAGDSTAIKLAALPDRSAISEQTPSKKEAGERPARSIKARLKAERRAKARRRLALRARAAQQQAAAQQSQVGLFGQQPMLPARTP
jgi:hypothetical protein